MQKNYYSILGVPQNALDAEIRRQYRALARKYHPDSNPDDPEAGKKFEEIAEAYSVLGNAEKRSAYDNGQAAKERRNTEKKKAASGGFKAAYDPFHFGDPKFQRGNSANPIDMTEMFERYMGIKRK